MTRLLTCLLAALLTATTPAGVVILNATPTATDCGGYTDIMLWAGLENCTAPCTTSYTIGSNDFSVGDSELALSSQGQIQATTVKVGTNAFEQTTGSPEYDRINVEIDNKDIIDGADYRIAFWMYIATWVDGADILGWQGGSEVIRLRYSGTDELKLRWAQADSAGDETSSAANISTATWYFVEIAVDDVADTRKVLVDGVEVISSTDAIDAMAAPEYVFFGAAGALSSVVLVDNIMISNDADRDFCGLSGGNCEGLADDTTDPCS